MQLLWSEAARDDLERIAVYLAEQTPYHAERLVRTIYAAPLQLLDFPQRGRHGRRPGTRELILPALPYLVIYTVSGTFVSVVRILHGAQKWP